MLTLAKQFQTRFAHRKALHIALSATLSLLIVLLIPLHQAFWFGWFAPFSVIITMLMFPHEPKQRRIFWERFAGIAMGCLLGLVLIRLLGQQFLLYALVAYVLGVVCMYQVGNHHYFHYGYFLAMIFIALTVAFYFSNHALVGCLWQFPSGVIVAGLSVYIVDWFLPAHTTETILVTYPEQAMLVLSGSVEQPIDLSLFQQWKKHIEAAKAQMSAAEYALRQRQSYLLRLIAYKWNLVSEQWETLPQALQQAIAHAKQAFNQALMQQNEFMVSATWKDDSTYEAALCQYELQLIAEDLKAFQSLSRDHYEQVTLPTVPYAEHHTGLQLPALLFGLRAVTGVALSIFLVIALHVPGGVQTVIASIVTAGSPNMGASVQKMLMRAAGTIVGSMAGFLVALLVMTTHSLPIYLVCFLGFVWWTCRWSLRSQHFSYAGIQSGLIFLIMLSATGSSHIDATLAHERLIGVWFGSLIAFVVVFILAPVSPQRQLRAVLERVKIQLRSLILALQQGQVNRDELRQQCEQCDQLLSQATQRHFETRFLGPTEMQWQQQIEDLQHVNIMIKQLLRAAGDAKMKNVLSGLLQHEYAILLKQGNPSPNRHTIYQRFAKTTAHQPALAKMISGLEQLLRYQQHLR